MMAFLFLSLTLILNSCGRGGGGGAIPFVLPAAPFIAAELDSFPTGSVPPGLLPSGFNSIASVFVIDDSSGAPITNAAVTMNGVTLTYNGTNQDYEGNLTVDPGESVTLRVTVGGVTYTASATQFTSYPAITAPVSGAAWPASIANTITWSGGAPTINALFYGLGVLDAADPNGPLVWPSGTGDVIQLVSLGTSSFSIPGNSVTAGNRLVIVGIASDDVVIPNAASGSALVFGGFNYVPISVPVPVSTDSLVNGTVAANGSSYFSFTAAQSANHTIALTGLFSQLSWELFTADPGYVNRIQQCVFTDQAADLACLASLSAGSTYYLKVQEFSGAPQEFQLTIGTGALNEGSLASPVALAVGGPSRPSTVDVFGHSFFTFTPSVSGPHTIQLDGHSIVLNGNSYSFPSDYGWTLFSDSSFTTVVKQCRDYRQISNGIEHCAASLTSGVPYYLRVDEQAGYPNRIYELTVVSRTGGGGINQGAIGAPVPISFTSGWGFVDALGSSYYSFQTGASAGSYRIIATSATDNFFFTGSNLTWFLFSDTNFSNEIFRCDRATGIVAQSCLTPQLAASTTYYLQVRENDNITQSSPGGVPAQFALTLYGGLPSPTLSNPLGPVPVPLGLSGLSVVQDNTLSTGFYSFVTSQSGTYSISANLSTGDLYGLVAWYLYDDATFAHQIVHCFKSDGIRTSGNSCTVSLPSGTNFYLKVQTVGAQSGGPGSTIISNSDLHLVVDRLGP